MRPWPYIVAITVVFAAAPRAAAQAARQTVEASVTVVDPAQVRLDTAAATVREVAGGLRLEIPLRTSGAGSPVVTVPQGDTGSVCETVAAPRGRLTAGKDRWLRCLVPSAAAGGVASVPVTLLIVPAT